MSSWGVRLEGGPFDGDSAVVNWDGPVPKMWVTPCDNCKDTHWWWRFHDGGEPYTLDETNEVEKTAKYVHADADLSGGPSVTERELLHA